MPAQPGLAWELRTQPWPPVGVAGLAGTQVPEMCHTPRVRLCRKLGLEAMNRGCLIWCLFKRCIHSVVDSFIFKMNNQSVGLPCIDPLPGWPLWPVLGRAEPRSQDLGAASTAFCKPLAQLAVSEVAGGSWHSHLQGEPADGRWLFLLFLLLYTPLTLPFK